MGDQFTQQHLELIYLMRIVSKFLKDSDDDNYPPALDARIDYVIGQYAGLDESVKQAGDDLERRFKEELAKWFQETSND